MGIPKVFSLYKTGSFEECFPKIATLGRKVDFFLQCASYDALIPVNVKAEKRLDIFEEAVLRLMAYKAAPKEEMARILCLDKDLVYFIIVRLQEAGLVERDGYRVSHEGRMYLSADNRISQSVETVQAKLFVLKRTGEILPYIHMGEFETEYVSDYTPDSMTIEYGTSGRPIYIRGKCLRHKKAGDETGKGSAGYQNGGMLKAEKIRSAVRRFNRIAERSPGMDKIALDGKYAIENTRSEDINFHMQAVVQDGNSDEILVSDGLVPHVDCVGRYMRQEYPDFIQRVMERAVSKTITGEKKDGEDGENSGEKETVKRSKKYWELGKIWEEIRGAYSELKERHEEKLTSSEEPASGEEPVPSEEPVSGEKPTSSEEPVPQKGDFSLDQYKNDKAVQKSFYVSCYSAIEWSLYYHCMENPVSEGILEVLYAQTFPQNARTVETLAEKAGVRNPQEYHFLFANLDGGKIRRMYRDSDHVPSMNLCLPLALMEGAERAGKEENPFGLLLARRPGLLCQINRLKKRRDDLQHQAREEEIDFGYVREIFGLVKDCIAALQPDFILEDGGRENVPGGMGDSHSQERLNARVSLSKALGDIYFNSLLSEGLQNEWILISPDKRADRLPDPAGYVDSLYRIMQEILYNAISEFPKDSTLTKDRIVREVERREGKKLPDALAMVGEGFVSSILNHKSSTLGAHALVYLYQAEPEKAEKLVHMGYSDIIGKIADYRKHGNNVALQVGVRELNGLRDRAMALCREIGGEL